MTKTCESLLASLTSFSSHHSPRYYFKYRDISSRVSEVSTNIRSITFLCFATMRASLSFFFSFLATYQPLLGHEVVSLSFGVYVFTEGGLPSGPEIYDVGDLAYSPVSGHSLSALRAPRVGGLVEASHNLHSPVLRTNKRVNRHYRCLPTGLACNGDLPRG